MKMETMSATRGSGQANHAFAGAAALRGSDVAVSAPLSPVQAQLHRQRELLSELEGGANSLIDPLRSALTHDPRESKGLERVEAGQPPSCDLELVLLQANAALEGSIQRLRDIRNAIRL